MARTTHTLTTAPTTALLTTAEAKIHLREDLDDSDNNTYIDTLVKRARLRAEAYTGRAFVSQTWTLYSDGFPTEFIVPRPPFQSVTTIKYYDDDGDLQTLDSSYYQTDIVSEPGRILEDPDYSWPNTEAGRVNSVIVTYVAGYGAASTDVPEDIIAGVSFILGHLYANHEDVAPTRQFVMPRGARDFLDSHKVYTF